MAEQTQAGSGDAPTKTPPWPFGRYCYPGVEGPNWDKRGVLLLSRGGMAAFVST